MNAGSGQTRKEAIMEYVVMSFTSDGWTVLATTETEPDAEAYRQLDVGEEAIIVCRVIDTR
jgi:hypothetical protein